MATTTIATILTFMRDKGLVDRSDGPRGYVWSARITRLGGADSLAQRAQAEKFLTSHKPTFEDAKEKRDRGRKEASRDGKRVLLIVGGPRCAPCFRLGRWIDRQHELLEKDYVIVKVMENLEEHAHEISDEIGGANREFRGS